MQHDDKPRLQTTKEGGSCNSKVFGYPTRWNYGTNWCY